jgi:hypothetical protein
LPWRSGIAVVISRDAAGGNFHLRHRRHVVIALDTRDAASEQLPGSKS